MGAGSTKNLRTSDGKRLGVKCFGGTYVKSGSILVRQRGTKFKAGNLVGCGKDHTLYSLSEGKVKFNSLGYVEVVACEAK